jgi:RNA polymerase sigma-70 factor, ECF subfamily
MQGHPRAAATRTSPSKPLCSFLDFSVSDLISHCVTSVALMATTSRTLLEKVRDRCDEEAWSRFVERYWRLIYWVARRAGLPESDAEDVVQEVFAKLVAAMPTFEYDRTRGTFRAFIRTIAERHIVDRRRTRTRVTLPSGAGNDLETNEFEVIWEREWQRSRILLALDEVAREIEPRTYQAFQLVALEGWSSNAAGEFLEMPIASVYQAKSRVIARLRERLQELTKED